MYKEFDMQQYVFKLYVCDVLPSGVINDDDI